ncbi:hypothetical protein [Nocardioides sp. W7]|uniref:hypothetical protein n=1 Tax=Nocardioides sp. W7 TaxID=2931390 RepID=UPI001FD5160D|nr:hypothetical protein [Nocardioides sp. W7]
MSPEQQRSLIRFRRHASARSLTQLRDRDGHAFDYVLADQILELLDHISATAKGQIAMAEAVTNPSTRDRYIVSSLIEEAIASSQLEGASTTRRVAKQMITSGRSPRDRSERMILNNFVAMQRVRELRDQDLNPALVCEIQRIVTDGTQGSRRSR